MHYYEPTARVLKLICVVAAATLSIALAQGAPAGPPSGPPGAVAPLTVALVDCDGGDQACVRIKPAAADIVGVWRTYFHHPTIQPPNGLAYLRFTSDGRFVMAPTVEGSNEPSPPYPSGTYTVEDGVITFNQTDEIVIEACVTGTYEISVYYYGDRPVALSHRLEDACPGRAIDSSAPKVWVSD